MTAWPLVTAAAGGWVAAVGVLALAAGRAWSTGRRFDGAARGGGGPRREAASDWDALSRGEDPTRD